MELARGTVGDKSWALTLATFARRNTSGQITLISGEGKRYSIALDRGMVVAARSPMIADSVARVALTSRMVTSEHVAEMTRRLQSTPHADEVALLGLIAALSPSQVQHLRTDVTIRRAARSFAVESGQYLLEDKICLPVAGTDIDIRAVIYQGLHLHAGDERLRNELRALGGNIFVLEPHATDELHRYGFSDAEWPLLAALRDGTSLPEMEARLRDIDSRTMLAAVYSLVVCGTARVLTSGRTPTPTLGRTPTPTFGRTPTPTPIPTNDRALTPSEPVVTFSRTLTPLGRITPMPSLGRSPTPMVNVPISTRDLERIPVARTTTNPELAAEAYERGQRALSVDKPELALIELKKACELAPDNVDYVALHGWALFCSADDKREAAVVARKALQTAVNKSMRPQVARFFLGRIERMLGRDQEALGHFHAVLLLQPDHRDASAEIRVLQARLSSSGSRAERGPSSS